MMLFAFSDHPVAESVSVWQFWVHSVCGLPDKDDGDTSHARRAKTIPQIRLFLTETKRNKTILDIIACATILVITFLFGFYL